jgi:hypothetical protein
MKSYILSASRLMTAREVQLICANLKVERYILDQVEMKAKEKAASAVTLTASLCICN